MACFRNPLTHNELRDNPLFYTNLGVFVCFSLCLVYLFWPSMDIDWTQKQKWPS